MKLVITESQIRRILREYIKASEAHNDVESVRLICDGKRGVAFVTAYKIEEYEAIAELVSDCDLDSMKVPNNPHDAYIIFNKDYVNEAKELLHIAIALGGYLSPDAPEDVTRKIGHILNYDPQDVEEFINKRNNI